MGKCTGGIAKKGTRVPDKKKNDVFFHPKTAEELIEFLHPYLEELHPLSRTRVLDACCNDAVLGKALARRTPTLKVDLHYQDIELTGQCILDYRPDFCFDLIICNPPWTPVTFAEKVYWHLWNMLEDDGIMFFIINNTFMYQGADRAESLNCDRFHFLPRYTFKSAGKPLLDCGVAVVTKNRDMFSEKAMKLPCYIPLTRLQKGRDYECER